MSLTSAEYSLLLFPVYQGRRVVARIACGVFLKEESYHRNRISRPPLP